MHTKRCRKEKEKHKRPTRGSRTCTNQTSTILSYKSKATQEKKEEAVINTVRRCFSEKFEVDCTSSPNFDGPGNAVWFRIHFAANLAWQYIWLQDIGLFKAGKETSSSSSSNVHSLKKRGIGIQGHYGKKHPPGSWIRQKQPYWCRGRRQSATNHRTIQWECEFNRKFATFEFWWWRTWISRVRIATLSPTINPPTRRGSESTLPRRWLPPGEPDIPPNDNDDKWFSASVTKKLPKWMIQFVTIHVYDFIISHHDAAKCKQIVNELMNRNNILINYD